MLHLAQNIRRIRLLTGDTQPKFAKRIGVPGITHDMVSTWERNIAPPNEVVIQRIAAIVEGVSEDDLLNQDLSTRDIYVKNPDTKKVEFKFAPINGANQQEKESEHLRQLLKEKDAVIKEKDERIKLLTQLLEKSSKKS